MAALQQLANLHGTIKRKLILTALCSLFFFLLSPHIASAASRFWVGGTGTWDASDTTHWAATSNGAGGQSVPGASDTVTLDASSGGGTVTLGYSPTVTSITMGAFTGTFSAATFSPTMSTFSGTGTGVRTLNMGSGTWTITGTGTVWNMNISTNITLNANTSTIVISDTSAATKTILGGTTTLNDLSIPSSSGGNIVINASAVCDTTTFRDIADAATGTSAALSLGISCATINMRNVNLTDFTGTFSIVGGTNTITGTLTFSATTTWAGSAVLNLGQGLTLPIGLTRTYTGNLTFNATSGAHTITTNGIALASAVVFNGVGGSWQLGDSLTTTGALTLTSGTFSANTFNVTANSFNGSGSTVRTLNMGSGTWTVTGAGDVWITHTNTNLTFNAGTSTILIKNATTSQKNLYVNSPNIFNVLTIDPTNAGLVSMTCATTGTTFGAINVAATGTSSGFTVVSGCNTTIGILDFTGFTGSWNQGANIIVTGAFTLSSTMTWAGSFSLTLGQGLTLPIGLTRTFTGSIIFNATSGTHTITTNAIALASTVTFNGVGGTWQLQDALLNSAGISLVNGTFNANNFNVTALSFVTSGTNARTLTMGSGAWTMTGTGGIWDTRALTNLTLNANTSTILIKNATTTQKTFFAGDSQTFNVVTIDPTNAGTVLISCTSTGATYGTINAAATGTSSVLRWDCSVTKITNLDFTGFTGTWSVDQSATISGSLTLNSVMTWAGSFALTLSQGLTIPTGLTRTFTGSLTFNATSGTKTITTNGVALASTITFNGVGGTWLTADALTTTGAITVTNGTFQLGASLTTSGQITLTSGTFDAGTFDVTATAFNTTNSNIRTLNMGSGTWTLTTTGSPWSSSTSTNLTLNAGASTIVIKNSAAVAKTFAAAATNVFNILTIDPTTANTVTVQNGNFNTINAAATGASSVFTFGGTVTSGNLNFTGFTGIWNGATGATITGALTLNSVMTWAGTFPLTLGGNLAIPAGIATTYTGTLTFNATSGVKTITTNGVALAAALTFNGVGGAWQLADALATSGVLTLTNGTFDANNLNVTTARFASSNTNVRTLTMGSGTWTVTGNNATIWNIGTATNLILNNSPTPIQLTYSGSTGTRTITPGIAVLTASAPLFSFAVTAGTDIFAITGGYLVGNLDFTGFSGTFNDSGWYVLGNLTISAGMTLATGTTTNHMVALTGTTTVTTNGKTLDFPIDFGNISLGHGTVQLADDMTIGSTRTMTVTSASFDANGHNVSTGLFASSNTNTRTITMGSGTWTVTGNNTTIWDTQTVTNLTLNKGNAVNVSYAGATGTRTIKSGSIVEASAPDFSITAGTDTVVFSAGANSVGNLDFTGFGGTLAINANVNTYGNLTFAPGMAITTTAGNFNMAATSGTKTITTNGKTIDTYFQLTGAGTFQLADDLTVSATKALTLAAGTFDANGHNVTTGGVTGSSTINTRSLLMGSGTWTLTGNDAIAGLTSVWNFSLPTNASITPSTSTIKLIDASATAKTFAGGDLTYNNLWLSGAGTGNFIIDGSNTFSDFKADTPPHTLQFTSGTNTTVDTFTVAGTAGNMMTIGSTVPGSFHTLTKSTPGTVTGSYLFLSDSHATPDASWEADATSTDNGGNTGWFALPGGGSNNQGTLTVTKIVQGGSLAVSDFQLFLNGSRIQSGQTHNLNQGSYVITETPVSGYTLVFDGDCNAQGKVLIVPRGSKVCTLTNTSADFATPTPSASVTPTPSESVTPTPSGAVTPTPVLLPIAGPGAFSLASGDLIRATGDIDIYFLNQYGYKRLYVSPAIFNLYYRLGWDAVKSVTPAVRDALQTSSLYRNCGSGDTKVYGLEVRAEDAATLHWVNIAVTQAVTEDPNFFKKVFCMRTAEQQFYGTGADYHSESEVENYRR